MGMYCMICCRWKSSCLPWGIYEWMAVVLITLVKKDDVTIYFKGFLCNNSFERLHIFFNNSGVGCKNNTWPQKPSNPYQNVNDKVTHSKVPHPKIGKGVIFRPDRTAQHTQSLLYIIPRMALLLPVFFPNINKSLASGKLRTASALHDPWDFAKTIWEESSALECVTEIENRVTHSSGREEIELIK